jgi:hypothetical protein
MDTNKRQKWIHIQDLVFQDWAAYGIYFPPLKGKILVMETNNKQQIC